jgi:hypothetical protein
MSEGDRVARMLAAATAGRGLNAKIPDRPAAKRPDGAPRPGADTANRTGPTYKAHSSIAHQVTEKPMKPLERVQQRARELNTTNLGKDRRSIDQVQREIKGARAVDDERDFFEPRRVERNGKAEGKRRAVEPRVTSEDSSYVINKMGLLADEREHKSRNGHSSKASSSVPTKRRRRSITPSDASDASSQDFDSDDLDDVDVRRKKKKKQASTIGASTRRREAEAPRKRPPAGGSVLAAAGLDIYAMFGRKDREL